MVPVLPQDVVCPAVKLLHPPVHAQTLTNKQQIAALFKRPLTDEVLWRDEELKQPPQPVGVRLVAGSAEAEVPVALGLRGDVVENLLEHGEEPGPQLLGALPVPEPA